MQAAALHLNVCVYVREQERERERSWEKTRHTEMAVQLAAKAF